MALHILMEPKYEASGQRSYWGLMPGGEYICSFECEELFKILNPLFEEVRQETGKLIEDYGWASLCGEELVAVVRILKIAQNVVEEKPDSWEDKGWTSIKGKPYLDGPVSKTEVQELLNQILAATEASRRNQTCITFEGD